MTCSNPLVETSIIDAKSGTLIPLVNWSGAPIRGLKVTMSVNVAAKEFQPRQRRKVEGLAESGNRVFTLDLDVADALILR